MRRHLRLSVCFFAIILIAAVCFGVQGSATSRQTKSADVLLEIDASKTPELIPGWAPWESTFRLLKSLRGKRAPNLWSELRLTPEEDAWLLKEVDAVNELGMKTAEALQFRAKAMRDAGADPSEVLAEDRAGQIEYRLKLLDAVERLRVRLPPQAFGVLDALVEQMKHSMKVSVWKSDLEHFRKPR